MIKFSGGALDGESHPVPGGEIELIGTWNQEADRYDIYDGDGDKVGEMHNQAFEVHTDEKGIHLQPVTLQAPVKWWQVHRWQLYKLKEFPLLLVGLVSLMLYVIGTFTNDRLAFFSAAWGVLFGGVMVTISSRR